MGRRGPRPEPSATKRQKGTYRADRRRGEIEPKAELPKPPRWLDAQGRRVWREVGCWLADNGLLTQLDSTAFAILCAEMCEYVAARAIIDAAAEETGTRFIATTDKGNIIQHPAVGVKNKTMGSIIKLCREFGMTPSSRAGMAIAKNEAEKDPMSALIEKLTARRMQSPSN